jgi:hypothetical protein
MAVARQRVTLLTSEQAEQRDLREIEDWYRAELARTPPPAGLKWDPVKIGPTWQYTESGWLLPEYSLGWGFLAWAGKYLKKGRSPWAYTMEQARFLLHFYAIEPETSDFCSHSAILQRLKGWGKDPLAATMAAGSLHAPTIFDRWDGDRPLGRDEEDAWTQVVAVSLDQTKNTMKLFPGLFTPEAIKKYGIQIGKRNVWSDGDRRQIEAVTASPAAIEGGRPKLIVRNETQNWTQANGGHEMAGAIEGNAAKAEEGHPARILDICNAYVPGRDSVAERQREAYEATLMGLGVRDFGVLLDSLEAPPAAPLTAEEAPEVVKSIAGDATWLDVRPEGRIIASIMNPANSASESRRKWYNQITGTEDAWAQPQWIDQNVQHKKDPNAIEPLQPGDRVVLFGDGSKSGDDTGLIACRLSDGYSQVLWHFHPTEGQIVDREALDTAVDTAFDLYRVKAFWFDPSHAKDDGSVGEDDRFWWPYVDRWHANYHRRIERRMWATQAGASQHAIAFDMLKPGPQQQFQPSVSQTADDLERGECPIQDSRVLRQHMKNARRREARYGMSMGKEHRSSSRKIDLAVCLVGARMLRRHVLIKKPLRPNRPMGIPLG